MNGPTLFNLVVITLVELGAVFWVGAQLWLMFVLQLAPADNPELASINQQVQQRFERRWSLPTLLVLLAANLGILLGQVLTSKGQFANAGQLISSSRFGTYWTLGEVVISLALVIAIYTLVARQRPRVINHLLPSVNLLLGCMLFIAITLSGHASSVSSNIVIFAVLLDWLHLLAAALWVGGLLYITTIYLPVLSHKAIALQAHSLTTLLSYFTPLAIAGVVIVAITGPFSAIIHMSSWQQLLGTAYGRALSVKSILGGALLITTAIQVGYLLPQSRKEFKKYAHALKGVTFNRVQQVKMREERLTQRTHRLGGTLRWQALLGVAIIICVGLMYVFAGTLSPSAAGQSQQPVTNKAQAFNTSVHTGDNKFTVKLNVNPDRFGANIFAVTVIDKQTGKATTNLGVTLFTTMLDMDMGTTSVALQPDGKGNFSAAGDLSMSGNWQIEIQIRTPDKAFHSATVKLYTPI
jgi:copper transport protein